MVIVDQKFRKKGLTTKSLPSHRMNFNINFVSFCFFCSLNIVVFFHSVKYFHFYHMPNNDGSSCFYLISSYCSLNLLLFFFILSLPFYRMCMVRLQSGATLKRHKCHGSEKERKRKKENLKQCSEKKGLIANNEYCNGGPFLFPVLY